jgi:hypothetical protein
MLHALLVLGLLRAPIRAPSSSQLLLGRRCAIGVAALPLLGLAPLASIAKEAISYLPPGEETEEWKTLDARAAEFRKKQQEYKKVWEGITAAFIAAPDDETALAALTNLKTAFDGAGSLPESVSRDTFLKTVRRKQREMEAAGKWSKPVRMQVLELKTAIDVSQRPKSSLKKGDT